MWDIHCTSYGKCMCVFLMYHNWVYVLMLVQHHDFLQWTLFTLFFHLVSTVLATFSSGSIPSRTASNISVPKCTQTPRLSYALYTHMLWNWSLDNITKSSESEIGLDTATLKLWHSQWKLLYFFSNFLK